MRVKSFVDKNPRPVVGIYSFGSKNSSAPAAQFSFDVSAFRDPTGQKQFEGKDGTDPEVVKWVLCDDRARAVVAHCLLLADDLVKPKVRGDKAEPTAQSQWLSFSFKDFHGKWTAPAVAE